MSQDGELAPGAATEIYRLGYAAGQASTSTDAKLLKDQWWAGYAVGMVDAFGGEQPAGWIPTEREFRTGRTQSCSPYGLRGRPMFGEHLGRKR